MSATQAAPAEFADAGKPIAQPFYLVDMFGNPLQSTDALPITGVVTQGNGANGYAGTWSVQQSLTNKPVPAGAGTTVLKAFPGTLTTITVISAGTASLLIYDNATTNAGTVLFASPTTTSVGQTFNIFGAALVGMTAIGTTGSPAVTVYFS